jgi:methyltransferase
MLAIAILVLVTLQRLSELVIARRNTAALLTAGGREIGAAHYPIIVVFHAAWIGLLWYLAPSQEVRIFWLGIYLVLQVLRAWVLLTLGRRWTTRIITMPKETLVARGPFKYVTHPNYMVVQGEIMVLPLVFGLTAMALGFGFVSLIILWWRIRTENQALLPNR